MSLPNALAFCASSPRNQRIRVTIGSRPGELARTSSPVRRRLLNTVPGWRIVANFFRYLQIAERRKPAASPIAKTELGGGDGISGHEVAAIEERQLLVACADHDLVPRVRRRARRRPRARKALRSSGIDESPCVPFHFAFPARPAVAPYLSRFSCAIKPEELLCGFGSCFRNFLQGKHRALQRLLPLRCAYAQVRSAFREKARAPKTGNRFRP